MSDDNETISTSPSRSRWWKFLLVGMSGYLLGSFFPAGYINYMVRSALFPETLGYQEEVFDRSKLKGAIDVTPSELTDTLDANPSLFVQKYLDKPVKVSGRIEYFINASLGENDLTFTIFTSEVYGATSIFLSFDDPKNEKVVGLRKGGPVTAICMVSGTTTNSIHLKHCEVASK